MNLKYKIFVFALSVYVFLFEGNPIKKAVAGGALSVGTFAIFAMLNLSVAWAVIIVALVIIRVCIINR